MKEILNPRKSSKIKVASKWMQLVIPDKLSNFGLRKELFSLSFFSLFEATACRRSSTSVGVGVD